MIQIIVLIAACLLNGLLGLFVYLKNPRSLTNKLFYMLTGSFITWSVINYLSLHPIWIGQLEWIRLVLFSAAPLCLLVFLTFTVFPDTSLLPKYVNRVRYAIYITILVMGLTLSPLVFKSLVYNNGHASPKPGPGIGLFLIQSAGLILAGIATIVSKYRRAKAKEKDQLRFILLGIAGAFGLIVTTDFLLVVTFKITSLVPFGPAYTLVFSGAFTYAILRHRLFDIRAAIARSVAYLLVLAAMSFTYAVLLFGVVDLIFRGSKFNLLRQILSIVLVTPLALSFQSSKKFFDKITNTIFFRHAYDVQEVLNEVGNIVVLELELHKITGGVERVLYKTLGPAFIEFVLFKKDKPYFVAYPQRTVTQDMVNLGEKLRKQKQDLIDVTEINSEHNLYDELRTAEVALSLKLKSNKQVVGYALYGFKRSGDIYSRQDKRMLLILANEIAIAIQNSLRFEEIRNFNLTLQASVDEATRKLRGANEKLKALDETKDDFISMASHQLRTPLTSIKGYLSMMLEGDAGKLTKPQRDMIGQAFASSQRMVYLIADMLNVSRLRTGKFTIESRPVNLSEVVDQEIDQLVENAKSKSLQLTFRKPSNFPALMLDETKIRQVIMNFTDNAIYYTPAGGHIEVILINNPNTIELRVKDDGIGVPKAEQHHLFTKFYRAGNARKARPDGTGLGLYMAKKVIIAQGGVVIFETQEGKGSTFGFIFSKTKLKVPDGQPKQLAGSIA